MNACSHQIRILGTQPPAFRPCKLTTAVGETHCARHGGKRLAAKRKPLSYWTALIKLLRNW